MREEQTEEEKEKKKKKTCGQEKEKLSLFIWEGREEAQEW